MIRIKEGKEWKTAFRIRYGSYKYLIMPFGLTNTPALCQALVNNILRNILDKCVIAYLDNILIYSKTFDQHQRDIANMLVCLAKANMKLEPTKYEFHKKSVAFLGYIVNIEGIQPDPEKVQAILNWPEPINLKQL